MSEISSLETRISAALDRIASVLDGMPVKTGAPDGGDPAQLQEELQTEREANAQLEERVRAIKNRQEKVVNRLEAEVARLREKLTADAHEMAALREVNAQLRDNNRALRDANAMGLTDPELINAGMVAELDALRKRRAADKSELDAILAELQPLIEGNASA